MGPRRLAWVIFVAVGCSLGAPATVSAATAHVVPQCARCSETFVHYTAAPGEQNDVAVSSREGDALPTIRIADANAQITAGAGCTSLDGHTVECLADAVHVRGGDLTDRIMVTDDYLDDIRADGGDGDDLIDAGDFAKRVLGGPGNDLIEDGGDYVSGGPGDDRLYGSSDHDSLHGGGGRDEVYGLGGSDTLSDGDRNGAPADMAPGPDLLDGGRGDDTVTYGQRTGRVVVDLRRERPYGAPGEGDTLRSFENAVGGAGPDRLTAGLRGSALYGRAGADRLVGSRRADYLTGDRGRDSYACGGGRDEISWQRREPPEAVPADCEWLIPADFDQARTMPKVDAGGAVTFDISCPLNQDEVSDAASECRGNIKMTEASGRGRLLASGTFSDDGIVTQNRSWLTPLGKRLARRPRGARTLVSLRGQSFAGFGTLRFAWIIRLKVPR